MAPEGDRGTDEDVPLPLDRAIAIAMSPTDFERYTVQLLAQTLTVVEDFRVEFGEKIDAADGTYDIDATVRFRFAGMDFLVLVECKRHSDPIKRDVVALLTDKVRNTGAHKGIVFSTAPFQSGALRYAKAHGVALVHVTDAGPTYVMRSMVSLQLDLDGSGSPVAHHWQLTAPGTLAGTLLDENPTGVLELLTSGRPRP